MINPTQFTSGPWSLKERFNSSDPYEIIGNIDGEFLSDGPRTTYTEVCEIADNDDAKHNARLIAASPLLFATLLTISKYLGKRGADGKGDDEAWALFTQAINTLHQAQVQS